MWQQGRPLTRTEILDLSPERSWKASSIHILLNKLLDKEAIVVDGYTKIGRNYGRTYSPAIPQEDYEKAVLERRYKNGKLPIAKLVANLIDDADDSVIDELEAIIKKRKDDGK